LDRFDYGLSRGCSTTTTALVLLESHALLTEPLDSFWLLDKTNAGEVEPFIWAVLVVACNHVAVGYVLAEAI